MKQEKQETREKINKKQTPGWLKKRIDYYKPSTIRAEAERDYLQYKEHGNLRRSPEVIKKTITAVLLIVIITLILGLLTIITALMG